MGKPLAQIVNPVLPGSLGSGGGDAGGNAIGAIIGALIGLFLLLAFIWAIFYLLLGGFAWITSGGDKSKLEEARNRITNSIIGLIIVASVWGVMLLVSTFTGINFPDVQIPVVGQ